MSNWDLKQQLDPKQLMMIQSEFSNQKVSMAVPYLLWLSGLGLFGVHRFFLGRKGTGWAQLLLLIFGLITIPVYIGFGLLIGLAVWVFVDVFLIHGMVRKINEERERELLTRYIQTMRNQAS